MGTTYKGPGGGAHETHGLNIKKVEVWLTSSQVKTPRTLFQKGHPMALSPGLKVAGSAMTSVAEGLQAIPELVDKDEELQLRRDTRPLTREEARLRLEKTRADLNKPHFTLHGMYERDPATGTWRYTQTD